MSFDVVPFLDYWEKTNRDQNEMIRNISSADLRLVKYFRNEQWLLPKMTSYGHAEYNKCAS